MNGPNIELHSQFTETLEPYESLVNQTDGKIHHGQANIINELASVDVQHVG
jgi:hypothetical protein